MGQLWCCLPQAFHMNSACEGLEIMLKVAWPIIQCPYPLSFGCLVCYLQGTYKMLGTNKEAEGQASVPSLHPVEENL